MAEPVPPGRAGRLWLLARVASAARSTELLDRKRQLLRRELATLEIARTERRQAWEIACAEAERWGLRANVLGGADDVILAARQRGGQARVEVTWLNTMGVLHPGEPIGRFPDLDPLHGAAANGAVAPAAEAYRRALQAAVAHGAAERSHRLLQAELVATERRRRALEHHRLPFLTRALRNLELRLDELEREERVVVRWAKQRLGDSSDAASNAGDRREGSHLHVGTARGSIVPPSPTE